MARVFYFYTMNKQIDYIIVGLGLAGIAFTEKLLANNKTFIVIDSNKNCSTNIAAGLYNPVVLKRFTPIWQPQQQINEALTLYKQLEEKLNDKFLIETPLHRKLFSIEEQNNWFAAADKQNLQAFLSEILLENTNKAINANYKFGEVKQTGFLHTKKLKAAFEGYLLKQNLILNENFDYHEIKISENFVAYKNITAKHIVFCEGFGVHQNPYFKNLPIDGTKGEILTIKAPNLKLNNIINSSIFILPLGNDLYRVGATYSWKDKTYETTETGKIELLANLNELINCPFDIVDHLAGIRPTTKDRYPIVGAHHEHKNMFILNGLGTRGVLFASFLANKLFDFIENNIQLPNEINIDRIYKKLFRIF